jgi:hypothetical protein
MLIDLVAREFFRFGDWLSHQRQAEIARDPHIAAPD